MFSFAFCDTWSKGALPLQVLRSHSMTSCPVLSPPLRFWNMIQWKRKVSFVILFILFNPYFNYIFYICISTQTFVYSTIVSILGIIFVILHSLRYSSVFNVKQAHGKNEFYRVLIRAEAACLSLLHSNKDPANRMPAVRVCLWIHVLIPGVAGISEPHGFH